MIGKKDTFDIFKQYSQIILEQTEDNNLSSFINRIKTSQLDGKTKSDILNLLQDKNVQIAYKNMVSKKSTNFVDQDTANEPDPNFAKEILKAREEQQKENPSLKTPPIRVTI